VRREIRGGVVDIMQLSFAKRGEDCGFCRSSLSLNRATARPDWVTRVDSEKEQGRPKSSGRSSRSQSGACFIKRSHKEPTCCPPFRRPKVSGGSIFAAGELKERE
jgi:hypothetical protein